MKIGIVGSGVVAQQIGLGLIKIGHEVKLGSRNPDKLKEWLQGAGDKAYVGSTEDAAKFGEHIILATSWEGTEKAINDAGKENFNNKVVVDITNPLDFSKGVPPRLDSSPGNSGGENVQKWLSGSKVVKAFNTINAFIMVSAGREEGDPDLFIAGNDEGKEFVKDIASKWGWKSVIDIGDISQSYILEAFAMLWIVYGFKTNTWSHAFKLLIK